MRRFLFVIFFLCSVFPVYADDAYRSWIEDIEYILSLDSIDNACAWIQQSYSGYECEWSGSDNEAGKLSCKQEYPVESVYDCSITFSFSENGLPEGMNGACRTKESVEMTNLEEAYTELTNAVDLSYANYVSYDGLYVSESEWEDIVKALYKTYKSQIQFSYWLFGKNVVVSRFNKAKVQNVTEYSISADIFDARFLLQ